MTCAGMKQYLIGMNTGNDMCRYETIPIRMKLVVASMK